MSSRSRSLVAALALAAPIAIPAARADADILKLFAEAHGGAVGGTGLTGDAADEDKDFFGQAPHGLYGLRAGVHFLIFDGVIQHHQFTNGDRIATWTQFAAGLGIQADLGSEEAKRAHTSTFVELGVTAGFGLGTGQQVDPPLSNDEITDKGFVAEGRLGFGKHLNKLFDVGVAVPVSWSYLFKNGFDDTVNDRSTHYSSLHVEGIVYLRMNLKLL